MLRNKIAKNIGLLLQDKMTGTTIQSTLKFLENSQYWDSAKMEAYRLNKLQKLIAYSYKNVPYYTNLFDSINLKPNDIRCLEDIKKIPVLTKEIIRREHAKLISKSFNKKLVKIGKTGGTTGVPVITYKDNFDRTYTWASYYRWYHWMNLDFGDKTVILWGAKTILTNPVKLKYKGILVDFLQNTIKINSFQMNEDKLPEIVNLLNKNKPKLIRGYTSSLLFLADYLRINKIKLNFKPVALSTTTESLLPQHRIYLESIFNAEVYDQYGCGEVRSISFECSKHKGLHINTEHVILEILDENNQNVIDKSGRIVVTNFDNYVMPYIRYDNGDISQLLSEKCTCAINQPLMKSIDGRAVDSLFLKGGENVHGVFITDIFYELNIFTDSASRFQVFQNKPGKIELRFEKNASISQENLMKLENALSRFFSEVNIVFLEKLPCEPNGKFKYIKSELNKN